MSYTLGTAAKATGKSKPTIFRAIKNGTISANKKPDGSYIIEPAELHRVFPAVTPANSNDAGTMKQSETPIANTMLHREIELLQERLKEKEEIIKDVREERDRWRKQAETLAITAVTPPPKPPEPSQRSQGFLAWLLGK